MNLRIHKINLMSNNNTVNSLNLDNITKFCILPYPIQFRKIVKVKHILITNRAYQRNKDSIKYVMFT